MSDLPYIPQPTYTPPPRPKSNAGRIFGCLIGGTLGLMVLACCLVCIGPVVGVSAIAALLYSNQVERSDSMSVRLEPNDERRLILNDAYTTLRILPGQDKQTIQVDYTLEVSGFTQGAAEDQLAEIDLRLERTEEGIEVVVANAGAMLTIYNIDMTITLPPQMDEINLILDEDVYIEGIEAFFNIDVSGGFAKLTLADTWGVYQLKSGSGNINVLGEFSNEASHRIESQSGHITLTLQEPANLKYTLNTGDSGLVDCPQEGRTSFKNQACQGRLGDGEGDLLVNNGSGDILLSVQP